MDSVVVIFDKKKGRERKKERQSEATARRAEIIGKARVVGFPETATEWLAYHRGCKYDLEDAAKILENRLGELARQISDENAFITAFKKRFTDGLHDLHCGCGRCGGKANMVIPALLILKKKGMAEKSGGFWEKMAYCVKEPGDLRDLVFCSDQICVEVVERVLGNKPEAQEHYHNSRLHPLSNFLRKLAEVEFSWAKENHWQCVQELKDIEKAIEGHATEASKAEEDLALERTLEEKVEKLLDF